MHSGVSGLRSVCVHSDLHRGSPQGDLWEGRWMRGGRTKLAALQQ